MVITGANAHGQRHAARAIASAFTRHAVQLENAALAVAGRTAGNKGHPHDIPKAAAFVLRGGLAGFDFVVPLHTISPCGAGDCHGNLEPGFGGGVGHVHQYAIGDSLRAAVAVNQVISGKEAFGLGRHGLSSLKAVG
jgi:hypothetical protein